MIAPRSHDVEGHGDGPASTSPAAAASHSSASSHDSELMARMLWTVPEAAFLLRVGVRTVWRLMADPNSCFPRPRRIRGRTLLARDEVLAFLTKEGRR